MPLNRVREIHLSRPYFHARTAVDAHLAPEREDFDLLFFVLEKIPGSEDILAVIEYYRDPLRLEQAYSELVRRLREK